VFQVVTAWLRLTYILFIQMLPTYCKKIRGNARHVSSVSVWFFSAKDSAGHTNKQDYV